MRRRLLFCLFFKCETYHVLLRGEVLAFSTIQLTFADVNATRTYRFEANEKDNYPNAKHLCFDTSQMAYPKTHFNSRECDIT